jgi:hypothetical protein
MSLLRLGLDIGSDWLLHWKVADKQVPSKEGLISDWESCNGLKA